LINIEATIRWKGYNPNDLKLQSAKRVWVICDVCGVGKWKPFSTYNLKNNDLCKSCFLKGHVSGNKGKKGQIPWNKGIPRTDEEKRKMSESSIGLPAWNEGIPHTEETRLKISEALKGKTPWNKGIEHTDETKQKIKEARLNNPCPESYRHVCSQSTRDKISKANTGHICTPEHKQKISIAGRGIKRPPWTDEHRKNASNAQKGKVISEEVRKKLSIAMTGRKHSAESMQKMLGKNSVHWKGGVSFEPYCPKFNKVFKESIRDQFNRECFLCGKDEINNGKKLSVHHVNYDKSCLCEDIKCEFVPLCNSCHTKTNNNRVFYEASITERLLSTQSITVN